MKTLMIITPHMSTGGLPQVVLKKVELLKECYKILVVEYTVLSYHYVVQRDAVIELIGDNFISLSENKEYDLFNAIYDHNPEYIMMEEFPETFMDYHILKRLYSEDRNYKIFETTHSSYSKIEWKKFLPNKFIFVSPHSCKTFAPLGVPMDLIEYPMDYRVPNSVETRIRLGLDQDYKHVVNIGLFTSGKNQGYAFEIARALKDYKIKFHFVGNQAINFKDYWEPIMKDKPDNCIVWGERNDTNLFIQSSDLHLFTSKLELNPLSIKESLEYKIPTLFFNLPTYNQKYDNQNCSHYLTGNLVTDTQKVLELLGLNPIEIKIPKIKVVHLLLDPDEPEDIQLSQWNSTIEKQNLSIECWSQMKHLFDSYVPRYTKVNRSELPYENCKDPSIINPSKEFINKPPVLSYGHYGAYKAHTQGIKENFDEDIDILIVAEGDSYTDLSPEEFYKKILDAYNICLINDGKFVSFAGPCYMSGGEWWKLSKNFGEFLEVPHFLMGTTYMIMKSERKNILHNIENTGWHSPDFWLAWNYHMKSKIFVSKEKLFYQKEGFSVLDYKEKELN
jgi:hypothetical protein